MGQVFSYIGLFFLASLIISVLIFGLYILVLLLIDQKTGYIDKEPPNWLLNSFFIMLFITPLISTPPAYYIFVRYWNYPPPFPKRDIQQQADATQQELAELEVRANKLRNLLNDPKQLTLSQVEQALNETLDFVEKVKSKTSEQETLIISLRQSVIEERAKADESRRLTEQVQSLTKEQLEAVKLLITQDAKTESERSFMLGILVSFPIGIITSLFSTWIFRKWGMKAKTAIAQEIKKETV